MASVNEFRFIGRLTQDPELRYTPQGTPIATVNLAVDRPFKNANGERDTDFFRLSAWRKTAEIMGNTLTKGRLIYVAGMIQNHNYTDKNGNKRYDFNFIIDRFEYLDRRPNDAQAAGGEADPDEAALPDDLPF